MKENIPIKINPASQASSKDVKKALNLNYVLAEGNRKTPKKSLVWPILALIFALLAAGLAGGIYWINSNIPHDYQQLIPGQSQAIVLLKVDQLNNFAPSIIPFLDNDSEYFRWLKNRVIKFLDDVTVSPQELISSFKEQIAFIIMPPASNQATAWLILAETKTNNNQGSNIFFDKVEQGLRKNFGLDEVYYRQIKIKSAHSLSQNNKQYYYTQINNYLAVSNDLATIHGTIDKIIGK